MNKYNKELNKQLIKVVKDKNIPAQVRLKKS